MGSGGDGPGAPEAEAPEQDERAWLRKRVEELEAELARKEQLLQSVVDHLPALVYARDTRWNIILINKIGAAYLGRDRSEIVGHPEAEFFPKEVIETWRENDERVVATGEPSEREESAPHADGLHTHRSIKFPVRGGDGAVWAVGGVSIDITAERRAEAARQRSETLLTAIVEHAPMLISSMSPEGVVTSLRGKLPATLSFTREQILGRSIDDLARGQPDIDALVRAAFAGDIGHAVIQIAERLYETWFLPDDHAGEGHREVVTVGIDVTEQRRAEEEQRRLAAEYIEAQRAAIRALSAPIIPITENALAVPLVGRIDEARAAQITESLLQGIAARRARFAIIDVTGVDTGDVQAMVAATALVRIARAAALIGSRVVLTGIGPQMAQTLLATGVELAGIVVLASLQDGIAYAIAAGRR